MANDFVNGVEVYNPKRSFAERACLLKKPLMICVGIVLIVGVSAYVTYYFFQEEPIFQKIYVNNDVSSKSSYSSVSNEVGLENADYSSLVENLLNSPIVGDLPDDARILLKFYNFDSGEREWESSYVIEKNNIEIKEIDNEDIFIFVHSKYIDELNDNSLCEVLELANKNNDVGIETKLSEVALMWKYKNMLEYKNCLGM